MGNQPSGLQESDSAGESTPSSIAPETESPIFSECCAMDSPSSSASLDGVLVYSRFFAAERKVPDIKFRGKNNRGFFEQYIRGKVFRKLTQDGKKKYQLDHPAIQLLKELDWTLNDGVLEADVRQTPTYPAHYATGNPDNRIIEQELKHLARVFGIQFDKASDYHCIVQISDPKSIQLLDRAWNKWPFETDRSLQKRIGERIGLRADVFQDWVTQKLVIQMRAGNIDEVISCFKTFHSDFDVSSIPFDPPELTLTFDLSARENLDTAIQRYVKPFNAIRPLFLEARSARFNRVPFNQTTAAAVDANLQESLATAATQPSSTSVSKQTPSAKRNHITIPFETVGDLEEAIKQVLEPYKINYHSNVLFERALLRLAKIPDVRGNDVCCFHPTHTKPGYITLACSLEAEDVSKVGEYFGTACERGSSIKEGFVSLEFSIAELSKLFPQIQEEMNKLINPKSAGTIPRFASLVVTHFRAATALIYPGAQPSKESESPTP